MDGVTIGFDQTTLRPAVDLAAATKRIDALASSRTLEALVERARLLEAVGRLDEAKSAVARALVAARSTGSRERSAEVRLLRASIAATSGNIADALAQCTAVVEEARASDWVQTWAAALQLRGVMRFSAQEWQEAVDDFGTALALRREGDTDQAGIAESELAVLVAQDRLEAETKPKRHSSHPLFGRRLG